ncbi:MAG: PilZ domain-containing protein [Pseudomonadota bacterium]
MWVRKFGGAVLFVVLSSTQALGCELATQVKKIEAARASGDRAGMMRAIERADGLAAVEASSAFTGYLQRRRTEAAHPSEEGAAARLGARAFEDALALVNASGACKGAKAPALGSAASAIGSFGAQTAAFEGTPGGLNSARLRGATEQEAERRPITPVGASTSLWLGYGAGLGALLLGAFVFQRSRRQHTRYLCKFSATMRRASAAEDVSVVNFSRGGLGLSSIEGDAAAGDVVEVQVEDIVAQGVVRWRRRRSLGVQFDVPLSVASFSRLRAAAERGGKIAVG